MATPTPAGVPIIGLRLTDPTETGLRFTNVIPESRHLTNQVLLNGSGIAAGDVDGDGRTDVFFAGFDNDNALFRNLGGWRFEEVTASAGVGLPGLDCTGAALADLDGDGDLDLVVNTLVQGTHLLFNDGRGRFTPASDILNPGRGAMTVALADVEGDGDLDLYVTNYRPQALMDMPGTRMTFRKVNNRLEVDTVNGRPATDPEFRDRFVVNAAGGIEENGEPDVLYRNVDGTHFVEVPWTEGAFLDEDGLALTAPPRDWGLSAMFRDLNGDGRLDLYVCNDFQSPDRLWLNLGGGRFRLAPRQALRRTSLSSMAVDFADVNRDGHDDFVVFEMRSQEHGQRMRWVRENFPHRPTLGVFDDRPQLEQNTLQLGRGDGTWAEIGQLAGLTSTEWSWSGAFLDVDLDGWEDLLVVNGMERAGRDLDAAERLRAARLGQRLTPAQIFANRRMFPKLATRNLAFRNTGRLVFEDRSAEWGFDLPAVSQAIALADLDNDGDVDVIVGNLNQPAAVYRNESRAPRLAVRLVGRPPNTRGIGARIELSGGPVPQSQEMIAGGRYLSSDDPCRAFAAGTATSLALRVHWPSGALSEVPGLSPNTLVEVSEPAVDETAMGAPLPKSPLEGGVSRGLGAGESGGLSPASESAPGSASRPPTRAIAFEDLTDRLAHHHVETPAEEDARQPLLPYQLNRPGPGIAWIDLDGDGDDDLVVGAGIGGTLAAFENDGSGPWKRWGASALTIPLSRDATALLGWPREGGRNRLLAALANYEDGTPLGPAVLAWDPRSSGPTRTVAPAGESSPGPMALADIDGDGDLDLFLGGRVIPGRWPAPASSRFYLAEGQELRLDARRSEVLKEIGLVSGAVFTDLDADGDADLVLATEWGPIRVLRQDPEGFVDRTADLGLDRLRGWWTSVAAGDFDNDGRMDLVAGNWGRNTPYEDLRHRADPKVVPDPLRVYHGDFNGDGVYEVIEAYYEPALSGYVPREQLGVLDQVLPGLRARFATHAEFGRATVDDVLGAASRTAGVLGAGWLETTLFLNRGDHFEMRPLPIEAQFAPVFGIAVADADGDGNEDLFLAQNFFPLRPHSPRCDAGLGQWLVGDGKGGFQPVPGWVSGVRVFGEQRGAAVADFDADGRVDLVVGQNGAETRLYRNLQAHPGIRVRLTGAPGNPEGVGARVRWLGGGSPAREVRLGGGYLSQDSLVQVLARPPGATRLEVVWPGKARVEYAVAEGVREITLSPSGDSR